jgi:hypothetical protein
LSAASSSTGADRPALAQRLRQGLLALRPALPPDRETILAEALTPAQAAAFRGLPPHDQAHLCRVYRRLREGDADRDLLVAALLHDVGKAHPEGRVRLVDRAARVVLSRLAPKLLRRLAAWPAPGWRRGLALAVHHPRLGAERAAALGCSPRTCWLIAHHHDRPLPDDRGLRSLVEADQACP